MTNTISQMPNNMRFLPSAHCNIMIVNVNTKITLECFLIKFAWERVRRRSSMEGGTRPGQRVRREWCCCHRRRRVKKSRTACHDYECDATSDAKVKVVVDFGSWLNAQGVMEPMAIASFRSCWLFSHLLAHCAFVCKQGRWSAMWTPSAQCH